MWAEPIMNAWGFTYSSIAWWWRKVDKWGRPRIHGGYWFRQTGEIMLLGIKGSPPRPLWKGEPGELSSERQPRHSQKPDGQYAKIDRVFPVERYGPRLEMFARRRYDETWDVFGNEVEGSIEL